jgi:hypothetical protein
MYSILLLYEKRGKKLLGFWMLFWVCGVGCGVQVRGLGFGGEFHFYILILIPCSLFFILKVL